VGESRVVWLEKEQFVAFDGGGHSVVVSSQTPENAFGAKPSDLLLMALASCTAVDVVRILVKQRQALSGLEIVVRGTQQADPPWRFTDIHLVYRLRGRGLNPDAVHKAIELAEGKYCSVSASLKPQVNITWESELLPEAD
jgi:putative redox protein